MMKSDQVQALLEIDVDGEIVRWGDPLIVYALEILEQLIDDSENGPLRLHAATALRFLGDWLRGRGGLRPLQRVYLAAGHEYGEAAARDLTQAWRPIAAWRPSAPGALT
jgi:hypothetical protein